MAEGDKGKAPAVTLPSTPFSVDKTQVRVLTKGKGNELSDKDVATVAMEVVNGKDGKAVTSSYDPTGFYLGDDSLLSGLKKGLIGQQVGSRVLIAIPPAEGFGTTGQSSLGIGAGDTMVVIAEVKSAAPMLAEAKGTTVKPAKDLPTVKYNAGTAAQITIPKGTKAPTKTVVQPLIRGAGATVAAGQTLWVSYTGALWKDGKNFDSSFDHPGKTMSFQVGTGNVIKGWDAGLVGQKVGSRVLLVIPPADGYGAAGSPPKISGTDTLVFVVDVLAAY